MKTRRATLKSFIAANAAVFAMLAAPAAVDHFYSTDLGMMPAAYAGDSVPKGQAGKPAGKGHQGQGGATNETGGSGSGQGGPGVNSDAKGPRYMGGDSSQRGSAARGGKPTWGQDGLVNPATGTTSELGRLNVSRAPSGVFDRQLAEAFVSIAADPTILDFYKLTVNQIKLLNLDDVVRLDSPLANLALLKDYLADGKIEVKDAAGTVLYTLDSTNAPALEAILLGSASDKTLPITQDTVYAIYKIITKTEPTADLAAIAAAAEAVRVEILYDHDN